MKSFKSFKKRLRKVLPFIGNKYFITALCFIVWLGFFDTNDFYSQYASRQKLNKVLLDKKYYEDEIQKDKKDLFNLTTDPKNLEKFAREKYLMKKDNEDLFVFVKE